MLLTLKSKIIAALGAIVSFAGIIIVAFFKGKRAKATEVQAETAKTVIETVKKDREIEKSINDLDADSKRDKLRKYASDK